MRQFSPEERKANGWEGDVVRYHRHPDDPGTRACQHCGKTMHVHGWIDTKEGGHIVCPGDWIITGVQGEHYPCKPDIFAATYEPVSAPTSHPIPTGATGDAEEWGAAFDAWFIKRGVWPRVNYEEIFAAGWNARPAPAAGDALDKTRLDWLEQHDGRFYNKDRISSIVGVGFLVAGDLTGMRHQSVRGAIDAAIAQQSQRKEA